MKTWILDAVDPLFWGDGRPVEHGSARGLALPPPQTVAGLVRTRQGQDASGAWVGDAAKARDIPVHGPFPALLDAEGSVAEWLFPRPADALLTERGLVRLVPLDLAGWGGRSNAPDRGDGTPLSPTGLADADPSKPLTMRPLWRWSEMMPWLTSPRAPVGAAEIGVDAPPVEPRTHLAIDPATGRAAEGMLFSVAGRRHLVHDGNRIVSIGIGLRTEAAIGAGVAPGGGERRLLRWRSAQGEALPTVPAAVRESARAGAVRVILATPAVFTGGWRPGGMFDAPAGSVLVAAAVGRPEVVSGWDLATQRPRATRRCAPAGTVYFLRLGGTPKDRLDWADAAWLQPRGDADRVDGAGILLLGAWDGALSTPTLP